MDGHLSGTDIAAGLVRSTRDVTGGPPSPFSTLLRMGFAKPPRFPGALVVSYTTVSPLPVPRGVRSPRSSAVCSLLHFPSGRPAWELPSILPCGVRTFLDPKAAAVWRTRGANASAPSTVPSEKRHGSWGDAMVPVGDTTSPRWSEHSCWVSTRVSIRDRSASERAMSCKLQARRGKPSSTTDKEEALSPISGESASYSVLSTQYLIPPR